MSRVTDNVSEYVRKRGINLAKMARDSGVSYSSLYDSLFKPNRKRDLRDEEFLDVCAFLGVDPREFAEKKENDSAGVKV